MAKSKCTCLKLPERPTSQDYNNRYLSALKCPIHSKVPDAETRRYERSVRYEVKLRPQKGLLYLPAFGVMQAVGLKQVGIKAFDTPAGWRAVSTFPTREDARAYLLGVLDTVKREQKAGIRTKRNLDPAYEGGLDFFISPVYIVVPRRPLAGRGWELSTSGSSQSGAPNGRIRQRSTKKQKSRCKKA